MKKVIIIVAAVIISALPKIGFGCGLSIIPDICRGESINFNDYTNMAKPSWTLKKYVNNTYWVTIASSNDNFSYTFTEIGDYEIELESYASVSLCDYEYQIFYVYDKLDDEHINENICRNDGQVSLENKRIQYGWLSGGTWSGTGVTQNNTFDPSLIPVGTSNVTVTYTCYNPVCSSTQNHIDYTIVEPPDAHFINSFPDLYQSDTAINILPYTNQNNSNAWIEGSGITYPDHFSPMIPPGDYLLTLHYQDPATGCYSNPVTQNIHVNADLGYPDEPTTEFNYNDPYGSKYDYNQYFCDGETIDFTITDFDTANLTYNIQLLLYNANYVPTEIYNANLTSANFTYPIPIDGLSNDIDINITVTNVQNYSTVKTIRVHTRALPTNPTFDLPPYSCVEDSSIVEISNAYPIYTTNWQYLQNYNINEGSPLLQISRKNNFNNEGYILSNTYNNYFNGSLCDSVTVNVMEEVEISVPTGSYKAPPSQLIRDLSCYSEEIDTGYFSRKPEELSLRFYDISDTSGTTFFVQDGKTFNVKINNFNTNYHYTATLYKMGNYGIIDTILNNNIMNQFFSITIPDDSLNNTVNLNLKCVNNQCNNCITEDVYHFMTHAITSTPIFNVNNNSCQNSPVAISFQLDSSNLGYYYVYDYTSIHDSALTYATRKIIVNDTDTVSFYDTIYFSVPDTGLKIRAKYMNHYLDELNQPFPNNIRWFYGVSKEDTIQLYKSPEVNLRFYDISDTSGTAFYVADGINFDSKINDYNASYNYNEYLYSINQYGINDTLINGGLNTHLFSIQIPDDSLNNLVKLQLITTNPVGGCVTENTYKFHSHARTHQPDFINIDSSCVDDTVYVSVNYNSDYLGYYTGSNFTPVIDSNQVLQMRQVVINGQDTINIDDSTLVLMDNIENNVTAYFLDSISDIKDSINVRTVTVGGRESQITLFHNPKVDFTVTDDNLFEGELVEFTNTSEFSDGYDYIYWNFGDNSFSYEDNPWHYYYISGNKDVILTINNLHHCQSTGTKYAFITVNSNASNPINTEIQKGIKILQDNDNVIIYLPDESSYRYQLITITGKIIQENNLIPGVNKESISNLSPGIYLVRILGNKVLTKKIIKQ